MMEFGLNFTPAYSRCLQDKPPPLRGPPPPTNGGAAGPRVARWSLPILLLNR